MDFGICRGPGTNLHGYQGMTVLNVHKWQHSGQIQGDKRSFRNVSCLSFFPFLHLPHTSLNPIPVPCSLLYLASCPAFNQQLPRTSGTWSLMAGGGGKEQNPSLLVLWPLTLTVTFSTRTSAFCHQRHNLNSVFTTNHVISNFSNRLLIIGHHLLTSWFTQWTPFFSK